MNKYNIDILISNDIGELLDKRLTFATFYEMQMYFREDGAFDKILDEAQENGTKDNLIFEEYTEDLSVNSPLNNPANFAN